MTQPSGMGVTRLTCIAYEAPGDAEWRRIARLPVNGSCGGKEVTLSPSRVFRNMNLRSAGADIDIRRWLLTFSDGSIQDLSLPCLLKGSDPAPCQSREND